ncbi:hypothetical protein Tco_1073308, partial [Tanacetum coccineum]
MTGKKVYPSIILLSDAALAKPGRVGPSSAHQSVVLPDADDVGKGAAPARTAEGARANKDPSSEDDASFPTMGDEIEKKLFPLVPGPYYMPYPYAEGQSSESSRVSQNRGYVSARVVQPDECIDCPHEVKKLRDQLAKDEGAFARAAGELAEANFKLAELEVTLKDLKHEVASLQLEKLPPCVPTVHASSSAYATSSSQKTFGHTSAQSASKSKKATQVDAPPGREFYSL